MTAMTALRMVDIHNSAARLRPKPMPPNVGEDDQNDHAQAEANEHLGRSQFRGSSTPNLAQAPDAAEAMAMRLTRNCRSRPARRARRRRAARWERWCGLPAHRCAGPRRTRSGSRAANRCDGLRSTDRASPAARARATARNTIRPRHRRCGEPAIAAVPDRSAPAPHRSRRRTAISRSIRAVFSVCPVGGKAPARLADDFGHQFRPSRHAASRSRSTSSAGS